MKIAVKRAYEQPSTNDGYRILVDRLWPRGLSKDKARIDLWLKDVAPSAELRKWFAHDPAKWTDFQRRYLDELKQKKQLLATIKAQAGKTPVTLIYGARDEEHNDAVVLRDLLRH